MREATMPDASNSEESEGATKEESSHRVTPFARRGVLSRVRVTQKMERPLVIYPIDATNHTAR